MACLDRMGRGPRRWSALLLSCSVLACLAGAAGARAADDAPAVEPALGAPVAPRRLTVPPPPASSSAASGPMVTVPEGEPLPSEPPPPRKPIADPVIQLEEEAGRHLTFER